MVLEIRQLEEGDLAFAQSLSTQAGWNQLPADWRRLRAIAPEGCFVGFHSGRPVGTSTAVRYDARCGWIGMALVHKDRRRQGFGTQLLHHAIAHLSDRSTRTIALDATAAGRAVYLELGFRDTCGAYRWAARGAATRDQERAAARITPSDWEGVLALDRAAVGYDRSRLLTHLHADDPDDGVMVHDASGALRGYGFGRPGRQAWYVGPIVARDVETARAVLDALRSRIQHERAFIDTLDGPPEWDEILHESGFNIERRLTRMVRGAPLPSAGDGVAFAGSGFATG